MTTRQSLPVFKGTTLDAEKAALGHHPEGPIWTPGSFSFVDLLGWSEKAPCGAVIFVDNIGSNGQISGELKTVRYEFPGCYVGAALAVYEEPAKRIVAVTNEEGESMVKVFDRREPDNVQTICLLCREQNLRVNDAAILPDRIWGVFGMMALDGAPGKGRSYLVNLKTGEHWILAENEGIPNGYAFFGPYHDGAKPFYESWYIDSIAGVNRKRRYFGGGQFGRTATVVDLRCEQERKKLPKTGFGPDGQCGLIGPKGRPCCLAFWYNGGGALIHHARTGEPLAEVKFLAPLTTSGCAIGTSGTVLVTLSAEHLADYRPETVDEETMINLSGRLGVVNLPGFKGIPPFAAKLS